VLEVNLSYPRHLLDNICSLSFNTLAAMSVTNACLEHNQYGYLICFAFLIKICLILCPPLWIVGRLDLEFNLDSVGSVAIPQTPVPRSTRPPRSRRRVKLEDASSDEEVSPTSVVPSIPSTLGMRSQRASKTAALTKMIASSSIKIDENDDEEEEGSEVTSEEDSEESDQYSECVGWDDITLSQCHDISLITNICCCMIAYLGCRFCTEGAWEL